MMCLKNLVVKESNTVYEKAVYYIMISLVAIPLVLDVTYLLKYPLG